MTWTKLGDEFSDETQDLSDAAFRTHVEALCWSNRRLLDLLIPKRSLKRFAETEDPETAAKELVEAGWWQDTGDAWFIGCRFAEWQLERTVIEHRRTKSAETSRRHRLHKAGDHSLCSPDRCPDLRDVSREKSRHVSPGTGRDGSGRVREALEEGDNSFRESSGETPGPYAVAPGSRDALRDPSRDDVRGLRAVPAAELTCDQCGDTPTHYDGTGGRFCRNCKPHLWWSA